VFKLPLPSDAELSLLTEDQRRSALALAEAILPDSRDPEGPRAADERTLASLERVLEHLSPWAVRAFGVAAQALDRAARVQTGRRFSDLDVRRQQALLDSWQANPVLRTPLTVISAALKFVHFDTGDVYTSLGGKLNVVQEVEQPRYLEQVMPATEWDDGDDLECEVVVVGTGAGGAVVGKELAERGHAVLFVEEGDFHQRDSFTGSSVQAHVDFYRGSLSVGNAPILIFAGRLVGGSTAINTGSCFRTPDPVLHRWCEELGTDAFAPEAMAPHFAKVERILEVGPANRAASGPAARLMMEGCDALGWRHEPMLRNAPGCMGEGFCDFGCRTDARKSTNLSYLPPALERGSMLLTGFRVDGVLREGGRAVGVEGVDKNGRRLKVRADAVVFGGGALFTPLFLAKQGLGGGSGQLGRNLTLHPSTGLMARFDERIDGHRHIPQGHYSPHFIDSDGILLNVAQADQNYTPMMTPMVGRRLMDYVDQLSHMAGFGMLVSDEEASGSVREGAKGFPFVRYDMTRGDVDRIHRGFIHLAEMAFAAGAHRVYPALQSWPVVDRDNFRRFRAARLGAGDTMCTSYHPLGTVKMGSDPKTSVVDLDHQMHDLPGLFIVDSSTVQGPLGVNPQVTIMAMATRAAGRIVDRVF
jgi:hypothetical protein